MGEQYYNQMKTFISAVIERFKLDVLFIWALGLVTGLAILYAYTVYCVLVQSDKVVLLFQ